MCRRDTAASGEAAARDEDALADRFRKQSVALHDGTSEFPRVRQSCRRRGTCEVCTHTQNR